MRPFGRGVGATSGRPGDIAMLMAGQCAPHFLFGLAEKKTGRARSKRKERLAQNLHVRAGLLNTGVFRICADGTWGVFYRLAPDRSLARVLRRDCGSGGNFGVVVERPALLNSLALCSWQMGAWQTARVAPAERGENGIRDFPGQTSSPRGARFIPSETRNSQPSPAGGRRYAPARTDPP